MNYRHAYHAGNFADLAKHAILLRLMASLQTKPGPVTVIDTHAGAGLYDLAGLEASRTGEADLGIIRLMAAQQAPEAFGDLRAAVARLNPTGGGARVYPGSPRLIAERLRAGDRLIACEARGDDHGALVDALRAFPGAQAVMTDGWTHAATRAPRAPAALMVLVDPPYEARDDAIQAAKLSRRILALNTRAIIAIWAPIKDLMSFDDLTGRLEDAAGDRPILIAEARLRPLTDPMRLNGAALMIINPPEGLEAPARDIVDWVAASAGEGGEGRVHLVGRTKIVRP
jgi:23S rRNA (adenine2030-N6)-methyltransferase